MSNNKRKNRKSIICIEKIPQEVIRELSLATLKGAIEFYKNPENVANFNDWLKKRNKSQEN